MAVLKFIWQKLIKPLVSFYRIARYWVNLILCPIFILLSFIYLMNPTVGIVEFIPDFFPIIGNIDEFIASIILFFSTKLFFQLLFKKGTIIQKFEEQKQLENLNIIDIESEIKAESTEQNSSDDEILVSEVEVHD